MRPRARSSGWPPAGSGARRRARARGWSTPRCARRLRSSGRGGGGPRRPRAPPAAPGRAAPGAAGRATATAAAARGRTATADRAASPRCRAPSWIQARRSAPRGLGRSRKPASVPAATVAGTRQSGRCRSTSAHAANATTTSGTSHASARWIHAATRATRPTSAARRLTPGAAQSASDSTASASDSGCGRSIVSRNTTSPVAANATSHASGKLSRSSENAANSRSSEAAVTATPPPSRPWSRFCGRLAGTSRT